MKKYKVGYTTGVFDLFHIGHLNIFKKAKEYCEYLIVGVTTDEETYNLKKKYPIITFEERIEIVKNIKQVDEVFVEENSNKLLAWEKLHFDVIFKGDDWKGSVLWNNYEKNFNKLNVNIIYFPYTEGTSSSKLRDILEKLL